MANVEICAFNNIINQNEYYLSYNKLYYDMTGKS